ncbi:MAG: hypothetical protein ACOCVL_02355, partial [Candidatus Sumerlaeota bacterium]
RLNAEATLLIATWRPGEPQAFGVPCLMRLASRLPVSTVKWLFNRTVLIKCFEPMDDQTRCMLYEMMEDADWGFVRWAFGAMGRFRKPVEAPNVWRLHGEEDKVLLPPIDDGRCCFVEGAGHGVSATSAELTNAFIGECLRSVDC